jgi:RNA polymerase sigma-70 factor, ECF subfamily
MDRGTDEFISLLTASQSPLYACILALLPDRTAAHDILQETNLTLWHKAADFEAGTNFMAWASRIARYHVLNYRRKLRRDRLIFDESLFAELCERQAERVDDAVRSAELLQECLERLSAEQRDLLRERYAPGGSVKRIAELQGRTVGAISQTLYRIRESLLNCLSQRLGDAAS